MGNVDFDLAELDVTARWQLRPPRQFPAPWACEWGFDEYGLWQAADIKGIKLCLRYIPPGQFLMGSPKDETGRRDNETQHLVRLTSGFWLAETTITQALWQAVMGDNPSKFKGDNLPVENVNWLDSLEFCHRLNQQIKGFNLTLPSEAQWEYACRAGTSTPFNLGKTIDSEHVNFDGNYPYGQSEKGPYRQQAVEVDSFARNAWGLYQMHGNVREWCLDEFENDISAYQQVPLVNGQQTPAWLEMQLTQGGKGAVNTRRVLRGGAWDSVAHYCRSAFRFRLDAVSRSSFIGLRVALVERSE
ncbi:formylglycine-generating enzyme family protein [Algibacillus agarilyticus]|uniref:formylglycine-generating enzyme family protein n=1 Tax=Algibacillus agarilyticus TaxID=2234133 RepID=UPI000DD05E2B|nr:formylglycine-generating enzyme family protein [Algibacillus agarilyticus]